MLSPFSPRFSDRRRLQQTAHQSCPLGCGHHCYSAARHFIATTNGDALFAGYIVNVLLELGDILEEIYTCTYFYRPFSHFFHRFSWYYGAVLHLPVEDNKLVVILVNFGDVGNYFYFFVIKGYLIIETVFFHMH